jgi:hypothetical protein
MVMALIVAVGLAGAYYAGQFVGAHDRDKLHAESSETARADESAFRLQVAHATATAIRDGKPTEALRVLDNLAKMNAETVAECLKKPACANWLGSAQRQTELKSAVDAVSLRKGN